MKPKILAGIDIGTNTFRLLIGEVTGNVIKEIYSDRIITRLGEGLSNNHIFNEAAVRRSIEALKKFAMSLSQYPVESVSAIGTSALRESGNSREFISLVKESTGLDILIASDEDEARMASLGMLMDLTITGSALLLDIGGGSTEFISVRDMVPGYIKSINIGAVYLHDSFIKSDPPTNDEIRLMQYEIDRQLMPVTASLRENISEKITLVGTAGTITVLSAMHQGHKEFQHTLIHNSKLSLTVIEDIFTEISAVRKDERIRKYPVLESSRADIIVPGTLILIQIMKAFNFQNIIVSDNGLREGIILDMYNKSS